MADSVGQIGLDLVLNQKQFDSQLNGIQKTAQKVGKTIAAAFAAKAIVDFGKSCLELGSDLSEVQNVVDVTFPAMSSRVDAFAKTAAESFGLSETMAKKFTGTFGSMAEAFGFSETQAYEMSTTLTGLAGDIASFYNITQDEAYTKLKSVFTGETESLKDLGVVMTQTALDSYALANGFGKTTAKMTEAEKVSLRYAFVQNQLANATGDFARTSDSWANQVRILSLQFDSLKATIGQGLINLFTPVIKVINSVISRVSTLANAFKSFTELITGNKSSGSGTAASSLSAIGDAGSSAASGISDAADATQNLEKATSAAGDAAEKAAKQALGLMGFDAINKISENSDSNSGSGSGSGSGGSGLSGDAIDYGSLAEGDTALDEVNSKFQAIIDRFKELQELFVEGFDFGLGDTSVFQDIQDSLNSIKQSCKDIFTSQELIDAANEWMDSLAYNLGVAAGSLVSVGATIADNLLGGLAQYLRENTDRIKQYLVDMLDIGTELNTLVGDFSAAFADIFSVFRSDDAKSITSDIIQIFSDGFMGVTELGAKLGTDILDLILTPIIENQESIKQSLEKTLGPLADICDSLADAWQYMWDDFQQVYDEHVSPLFDDLTEGLSEIVGTLVDGYNDHIAPVLDRLAAKTEEVIEKYVKPTLDKFSAALGSVFDLLDTLWKTILEPLFVWIADNIMPILAPVIEGIGTSLISAVAGACEIFGGFCDGIKLVADGLSSTVSWITDFIDAVTNLPGNIKLTVTAVKNAAWDKVKEEWDKFKNSEAVKTVKASVTSAYTKAKETYEKFKNSTAVKSIKSSVTSAYNKAKSTWDKFKSNSITKTMKTAGSSALNKAKKTWDSLKSKAINLSLKLNGAVSNVKSTVNGVIDSINKNVIAKIKLTAPKNWPFVGGKTIGPPPKIPKLAQGGFVKANTPQLAVIGDNTRYGEIVAPENKLEAMAKKAAEQAQNGDMQQVIALLQQIVQILLALNLDIYMDGVKVTKRVIEITNQLTKTTGKTQIIV